MPFKGKDHEFDKLEERVTPGEDNESVATGTTLKVETITANTTGSTKGKMFSICITAASHGVLSLLKLFT